MFSPTRLHCTNYGCKNEDECRHRDLITCHRLEDAEFAAELRAIESQEPKQQGNYTSKEILIFQQVNECDLILEAVLIEICIARKVFTIVDISK